MSLSFDFLKLESEAENPAEEIFFKVFKNRTTSKFIIHPKLMVRAYII